MAKPDLRALATVRLNAERSKDLSQYVLRLLSADETTVIQPTAVRNIPVEKVDPNSNQPHKDPQVESTVDPFVHGDGGPKAGDRAVDDIDRATGLASPRAWNEVLRNEEYRFARHGRPVTLMVAELDGFDSLAARLGRGTADRLISPVAGAMRRNARAADVLARTGRTRVVAMLPETDEIAAINYVERVRSECDMWLEAGALAVRLAIGWAQPLAGGHLADALRLADDRMNADRRRRDFRATASTGVRVIPRRGPISPAQ